jgi:hypothetical protein
MKKEWILLILLSISTSSFAAEDYYCSGCLPSNSIYLYNNTGCPASYFLSIGYGNVDLLTSPAFVLGGGVTEWLIVPKALNTCPQGTLRVDYIFDEKFICSLYTTVECVSPENRAFKIVSTYSSCSRPLHCSIDMYSDSAVFRVN